VKNLLFLLYGVCFGQLAEGLRCQKVEDGSGRWWWKKVEEEGGGGRWRRKVTEESGESGVVREGIYK
jgi:hypothetical protein